MSKKRINNLCQLIKKNNADAFLVSNPYNIFYLTGFVPTSPDERESFLLLTKNKSYFFTFSIYFNQFLIKKNKENNIITQLIEPGKNLAECILAIINKENITDLAFESNDLKFNEYQILQQLKIKLTSTDQLVNKLRIIKDDEEIKNVKKACELSDKCLNDVIKKIRIGMSETEIAFALEKWIKERGYQLAFDPIVAVDQNSAIPHYAREEKKVKVKKGSVLLIDFGVKYRNYVSDITRVFLIGGKNTEFINTYNKLLKIQKKTTEKLKQRVEYKDVDEFCRRQFKENHLSDYPHSTGHNLGLEVHELPKFSLASTAVVENNQIFTIEPGVYYEGKWGIRMEDTVVMKNGIPQILTKFPKELMIL